MDLFVVPSIGFRLQRHDHQRHGSSTILVEVCPGDVAKNVDSGDPVVNLMAKAIQNDKGTWSSTTDGSYVTDIGKIALFADGKHDAALQQARSQLGKNEQSRVDLTV